MRRVAPGITSAMKRPTGQVRQLLGTMISPSPAWNVSMPRS